MEHLDEFLAAIPAAFDEMNVADTFGSFIKKNLGTMPDWSEADLAIIGVKEGRTTKNKETAIAPDKVRKELYKLIPSTSKINMVDLGNIEPGKTFEDTDFALTEICKTLLKENVLPIIIGGTKDLAYAQFKAFQPVIKNLECSVVSAEINLSAGEFLQNICLHEPNYLFNINSLAFQSHYVKPQAVSALQKMYFNAVRLGVLRNNIGDMEPIFRSTDMAVFDIGAIKQADAPGNYYNNPAGLTSEEACQLAWYAGISETLRSFSLFEINPEFDYRNTTSKLGALVLWYFIDGFYNRKGDHPEIHGEFLKYRCTMHGNDPDIIFLKSKRTNRWWMEIPSLGSSESVLVPCSYNDYTTATNGEMPELFFKALQKILK
ncbi:MAG: formimidoylglutamase [Flavobacteriales bacterium]|nr:formimidoylglutamase [Flavobacteriales bacterium]